MTAPTGETALLSLERLSRRFGAVQALDEASLQVRSGTVHALLGENGAGKTTLMRVVFGLLTADRGTMHWRGTPLRVRSPAHALSMGIGMVHQHFTLVPAMTVAENVALGGHGLFDREAAAARVRDVGARAGLSLDPAARVDALPVGAQQRCEIVKALARDVQLLILDEPTAVLAPSEARELLAWVRQFADAGNAVVLITHKLRDALAVADDVTVLHRGRTVLSKPASSTTETELAEAMLGGAGASTSIVTQVMAAEQDELVPETELTPGLETSVQSVDETVLSLREVTWRDGQGLVRVHRANMTVGRGEIVGIAAVEGAGQHELLRLLAGRLTPEQGTVVRPADVGFVPEDRHRDALLLDAPLFENLALRGAGRRRGRMDWTAFRTAAASLIAQFDVRATGTTVAARTLSGGNQQKFVLGRELAGKPPALVVENPSRGLDFKATAAVQQALRTARDEGTAVVLYSSDLDEVLLLADRVYAVHAGQVMEVVPDRDAVGRAMLGTLADDAPEALGDADRTPAGSSA
ncbi:MAG TPA: ATP-binding cassette domain-containing protein [Gemmatimonas sp.]|uniref:ABC transporter ATP-binding protein n=1 Tax=Gemmatimonas sp. TaxID=1962908 RepID=UPI002ED98B79